MPRPSASLTFYGQKAEVFREVQDELAERWGYEPSNAEVGAHLLKLWNRENR